PSAPPATDTEAVAVVQVEAPEEPLPAGARIGRQVVDRKKEIEDTLADLFMAVEDAYAKPTLKEAFGYLLDLAMEKVPCESGSIYRADISARHIAFVDARGPKADELLRLDPKIPIGRGLVGVTVQEGVAIAISDAHKDPRFLKAISDRIGYEVRSVMTVPIQLEGQVMGAIQVINRQGGTAFDEKDLAVVDYLAHGAAEYLRRSGVVTV
ncbi:MAG: GAF domain-containing protein, partial [Deltaproteobacteria bacterium]